MSQFPVRSIPPWVHESAASSDEEPLPSHTSQWVAFKHANRIPVLPGQEGTIISPEEQQRMHPGDYVPWRGLNEPPRPPKPFLVRLDRKIMHSPFVNVYLRLIVFMCSAVAMALAIVIFVQDKRIKNTSAKMAIIIDAIALAYTAIITVDEFFSPPVGLRSVTAKTWLLFLDLGFIVFESANLSIAFTTGNEYLLHGPRQSTIRQYTLASVLMVALITWLLTFVISVLRLFRRIDPRRRVRPGQSERQATT
ncbi:MAG: hypothetical protein Q9224_002350 [Gallowayella concinna]